MVLYQQACRFLQRKRRDILKAWESPVYNKTEFLAEYVTVQWQVLYLCITYIVFFAFINTLKSYKRNFVLWIWRLFKLELSLHIFDQWDLIFFLLKSILLCSEAKIYNNWKQSVKSCKTFAILLINGML